MAASLGYWNHTGGAGTTGRRFTEAEKEEISTKTQRAWRWTFLVSGLEHPNVVKLIKELTREGPEKIKGAAKALSA